MNYINKNFSCIVIWYNPKDTDVESIKTYNSFFSKIYIVDNSNSDNSNLASQIQNTVYIPNFSNLGIAAALNIGCNKALADGFEWVMTMDQDSSWNSTQLQNYLELFKNSNNSDIKSFAPKHRNEIKSVIGDIKYHSETAPTEKILFQHKVMASGNIINLAAWKEVNGFNEDLFIDEVDHEFCYKLIKASYKICEFQNIIMVHTLGHVKKTILPRPCKHSGVRLFYIFRNMLYIKENFPDEFKNEKYKKYMTVAIIQKLFEFKFKDLSYIYKGIKAFKNNKFGKYSD